MIRIGVLMPLLSPWAREIARGLCGVGRAVHIIDFRVFCGNGSWISQQDGFQDDAIREFHDQVDGVHLLDSRFQSAIRYVTCAPDLRKLCHAEGIDLLFSLYGGGWAMLAYLTGVRPFAVFAVGSDVLLAGTVNRFISRTVFAAAGIVFANGEFLASQARKVSPKANVRPLLFGIDTNRFVPKQRPATPVKLVCTRGFSPVYNNEYLIEALSIMPPTKHEWQVVFTSPGPSLEKAKRLADEVLNPALRSRVTFLGGVSSDTLLNRLQNSHIYTSLSRSDGTSTSLLEALSCGLFPVLSDIPQNREWIDPERKNGVLAPLDAPEALAAELYRAITDDGLRQRATSVNRRLAVERANSSTNMAVMTDCLEALA